MKTRSLMIFITALLFYSLVYSYALAKDIKYERSAANGYASQHTGATSGNPPVPVDQGYNFAQYTCYNGDKPECRADHLWLKEGIRVDCANYASQSLIAGGLDFSIYDYKKLGVTVLSPVVIGKNDKAGTIGFPVVSDIGSVINVSYCFKLIPESCMKT